MRSRIDDEGNNIEEPGEVMRAHGSSGEAQDAPGACGPLSSASPAPAPEERVVRGLTLAHLSLATAESCTGGLLAARITDVPGASEVFSLGLVTYSNSMKMRLLGVPEAVLARCGAVSEEVAKLMAANVRALAGSDFGIGITGIAGPGGGSAAKPVGLVHICVAGPKTARHFALRPVSPWPGRNAVRRSACDAALEALLSMLEERAAQSSHS